jgi:hypothetical protein
MSLIKKPYELKPQQSIKMLVYGQPGIWKTSTALSSPQPLLLDFDNGVHRVNPAHQVDTVQIESYQNLLDVLNEDLSAYKTLVIDTAGKMLDYMSAWLIQRNPKLGKSNGALSLQGYGERKAEFNQLLKRVSLMGKHLVFVAHDKEETKGEDKIIRPEIGGSSGADLIKELDLVGYMEAIGKKHTISFNPCERYYGKNSCNLPEVIEVPVILDSNGTPTGENNLLTKIFEAYQNSIESRKELSAKYHELMDIISAKIDSITDAETANDAVEWAKSYDNFIWDAALQAKLRISAKAKELGLSFNKETKTYEQPKL